MALSVRGKKILIWSTIITILAVGGFVGYKILKEKYDKKKAEAEAERLRLANLVNQQSGGNTGGNTGGGTGGGTGGTTTTRPSELNTKAKVLNFQNYVINTKKDTNILKPDGADGLYGANTLKAWNKYGTDFKASTGASTTADAQLQGKIDGIRALALNTAPRTQLSYVPTLQKSPKYVDAWYVALIGKTETFNISGKVFRTDTGEPILNFIPQNNYFYNDAAVILRKTPTSATGESLAARTSLGKGSSVKLSNGKVFIYFSKITTQGNPFRKEGWIQNQSAIKIIQQAQFSGNSEVDLSDLEEPLDITFR